MKLTLSSQGVLGYSALDIKDEEITADFIKKKIKWFMEDRKVKRVKFKLEGEAEVQEAVVLACLFG